MPIRITLDELLAARGMRAKQVAALIGVTETHLSMFRTGKVKGVRFSTLAKLCHVLQCQPGDLMEFEDVFEVQASAGQDLGDEL